MEWYIILFLLSPLIPFMIWVFIYNGWYQAFNKLVNRSNVKEETKYPMGKCTTCGMVRSWQNRYCICPFKEIKN